MSKQNLQLKPVPLYTAPVTGVVLQVTGMVWPVLHPKSDAIDHWLNHWLQLQKKGKQPPVLKDGSGRLSEHLPVMTTKQKGKQITQYVDSEVSDNVEMSDSDVPNANGQGPSTPNNNDTAQREVSQTTIYPPSPRSTALGWQTWHTFLKSLSDNKNYQQLLLLLRVAKVSDYS